MLPDTILQGLSLKVKPVINKRGRNKEAYAVFVNFS